MLPLNLEQLLQLHALLLQETGGSPGLRDLGRLESAVATQSQNVFGEELYPGLADKAAALIRAIIADHPFVDGNKRTGMLAGLTLMRINGTETKIAKGELENFAVSIAIEKLDVIAISEWLRRQIS